MKRESYFFISFFCIPATTPSTFVQSVGAGIQKMVVVYGDQGINAEEYETATYCNLTKTQSEEEEEVKYNVAQSTNYSVLLERKGR